MKLALLWCSTIYLCLAVCWLLLRAFEGAAAVFSELDRENITREQVFEARHIIQHGMWRDVCIVGGGVAVLLLVTIWMSDQTSHPK
jgi:hypothetical protein